MSFDALNSVHYHVGFYMYISPLYASPIVCFHMRDIRIYLWKCLDQKWYFVNDFNYSQNENKEAIEQVLN